MRAAPCCILLILLASGAQAAPSPAAEVTMAVGLNTATSPVGTMRELKRGDSVFTRETLGTGPNSYLNLRLSDGSFVLLRPVSRFVIENYAYVAADRAADAGLPAPKRGAAASAEPEPPRSGALLRLMRGGFRAVSGAIGHRDPDSYRVETPVATIGVRGTDYVAVLCDAACASDPVVAQSLPASVSAEGALVAGVIEGGIVVTGTQGGAEAAVSPDQYVVITAGGPARTLSREPRFLRTDPIPNPRTCR